jgi:hypothetical protein
MMITRPPSPMYIAKAPSWAHGTKDFPPIEPIKPEVEEHGGRSLQP